MTASKTEKNIYQKLHLVMSKVGIIEKDKRNTLQNYDYASEFAIKNALQPLLAESGIMFYLEVLSSSNSVLYKTKSGGDMYNTLAKVRYHFVDIDNPESRLTGEFEGSGADTSDKGLYKAITGAIKYIMTSTFVIPTGDDVEKVEKEEEVRKPTRDIRETKEDEKVNVIKSANDSTRKMYFAVAVKAGYEGEKAKNIVKKNFNLESFNDATNDQLVQAMIAMNKKIKEKEDISAETIAKEVGSLME